MSRTLQKNIPTIFQFVVLFVCNNLYIWCSDGIETQCVAIPEVLGL